MGLAATQARLLFITYRQNDVSAQMQRVSNQTMILARDEDEVSTKYNQMLASAESSSSSSLVDSSTVNPINLTYDAMMGADGAGKYTSPYVIKSGNQVVLSSSMMNKLSALGGATSGSASEFKTKYPNATDFIKAVAGEEIASAYGTGSTNNSTTGTMSINSLLANLGAKSSSSASVSYVATSHSLFSYYLSEGGTLSKEFQTLANSNSNINVFGESSQGITAYYGQSDGDIGQAVTSSNWKNGRINNIEKRTMSLKELYESAGGTSTSIMLGSAYKSDGKVLPDLGPIKSNLSAITNNIGSQLVSALTGLGYDQEAVSKAVTTSVSSVYNSYSDNIYWDEGTFNSDTGKATSSKWKEAREAGVNYASKCGDANAAGWNEIFDDGQQDFTGSAVAIGMYASTGLHGIVATSTSHGNPNTWQFTLNLGNLVQDVVNGLMNSISGGDIYETNYNNEKTVNRDKEVSIKFKGASKSTSSEDKTNAQKANFYAQIYEQLASGGWVVDEDASDYTKLQEKIKNGTYTINGLGYQNYSNISEVAKTYTKDEAEAYYNTEMKKIQRKEKMLDQELTKLQTEYSSLTSDYESVKSIISQNVSRSFTYCQNG